MSLNKFPTEFTLKDLLDITARDVMLSLNCHAIGTVQGFTSTAQQTVKVSINYKKTVLGSDGNPSAIDYPILAEVPLVILGGGQSFLTFPIQTGDQCLVFFNDRDIDNWFAGTNGVPLASNRLHSFTDAIALIGPRSMLNALVSYDTDRVVLSKGITGGTIKLGTKVQIKNATSDLATVIKGLIDVIEGLMTIPAVVGTPLTFGPTSIAQLEAYKVQVEALLGDT